MSLDLPSGTFTPDQTRLLNDRLRRIDDKLGGASKLTADLDAQGHKIINLGDGVDTGDALNLVEAQRRFAGASAARVASSTVATAAASTAVRQIDLVVSGILGILSDAAPAIQPPEDWAVSEIVALVKRAPVGGSLKAKLYAGGSLVTAITVNDGATSGRVEGGSLRRITSGSLLTLDITEVGLTYPGSGLTVMVRRVPS